MTNAEQNRNRTTLEQQIRDMLPKQRAQVKQDILGAIKKGAWPQRNEDGTLNIDRVGVELVLTIIDYNTEVDRLLHLRQGRQHYDAGRKVDTA